MIIVDEYIAVRVVLGMWTEDMPDDNVALPTMGHWRLLQALHNPRGGLAITTGAEALVGRRIRPSPGLLSEPEVGFEPTT